MTDLINDDFVPLTVACSLPRFCLMHMADSCTNEGWFSSDQVIIGVFWRAGHFEHRFQVDRDVAHKWYMDRQIGEWCSYNSASGSFHTKKLCSRRLSTEVEFNWQNQQNRVLCHHFGDLGVTYTVHLWLVAKHVVDILLVLIEHFSLALTFEALLADIGQNCYVQKGGGSLWAQISGGMGRRPPMTVGDRKLESLGYRMALFAWS